MYTELPAIFENMSIVLEGKITSIDKLYKIFILELTWYTFNDSKSVYVSYEKALKVNPKLEDEVLDLQFTKYTNNDKSDRFLLIKMDQPNIPNFNFIKILEWVV